MESRLEKDISAFKSLAPILTFRAWKILSGFGTHQILTKGGTLTEIMKKGEIKNEKMLKCILNFLVGKKVLKFEKEKYFFISTPTNPSKDDYIFLYSNYYKSMIWADSICAIAPSVLRTGIASGEMGFGKDGDLDLWEDIMLESPYSFRQFLVESILKIKKSDLKILDFGCGGGVGIEQFLKTASKPITLLGVDSSKYYLDRARKKINILLEKGLNKSTVSFQVYNFEADKKLTGKHDAIFMSLVLNHLDQNQINELFSLLKSYLTKNGVIGIYQIVNNGEHDRNPLCWVMHAVPSHKCYPDRNKLLETVQKNFEVVEEHFAGNVIIAKNPIH